MSDPRDGIARLLGRTIRATGRGGGTTLPGRILLGMDRNALERLGRELTGGSVLISATNGKTTTSAMLRAILRADGREVLANDAGSNMPWGITTALLGARDATGLFEVDEAWLPDVADSLSPGLVLLGNLFRDQLDRYGETEQLAREWSRMAGRLGTATRFALNADDPLVAFIARDTAMSPIFFGIDDPAMALPSAPHARDAKNCRACGETLDFSVTYSGHLGLYSCPSCGYRRPDPDIRATSVEIMGMERVKATIESADWAHTLELRLPGLYNLYNALAAIAAGVGLGVEPELAIEALADLPPVFGRGERIEIEGRRAALFLVKNPVGTNEVIRALGTAEPPWDLWIALNDGIADGRDISWIWDADFEALPTTPGRITCSGTRAAELAVRLKYAGLPAGNIVVSTDIPGSFRQALVASPGSLFALPTYTAMLELREHLSRSTGLRPYWEKETA